MDIRSERAWKTSLAINMPPPAATSVEPSRLTRTLEYLTLATTTFKDIAQVAHGEIPFIVSTASLSGMILELVQSMKAVRDDLLTVLEQIHEVLCIIITIYSASALEGFLPPEIVQDIGQLTETLQKVYTHLKSQKGISRIKQLFAPVANSAQLELCKRAMKSSIDSFRLHRGVAVVATIQNLEIDMEAQHNKLVEFLAANSDLAHSELTSRTSLSFGSTESLISILPPLPKIFHGRDEELEQVIGLLLSQPPAHIALLGPGGIGKTSLALKVLHDPALPQDIFPLAQRYFVPCHGSPTCAELISSVAKHIGVDPGPNLMKRILRYLTMADNGSHSLLILDNFETPWEPTSTRAQVEEFLALLANVKQLGLLVTMRGTERPAGVMWTRPFLPPLTPLSTTAAYQTFFDIVDSPGQDSAELIEQLLDATGNLPLAITLIANVAAYEGLQSAFSRWTVEQTRVISDGFDKASSLDLSIILSLSSPRMTESALDLLGVLTLLPDGFSDADLVQSQLPLPNILMCKSTLLRTSLAYTEHSRIKVLSPIREYISGTHPPSPGLKLSLQSYF
ncbi:P-loop containing nucleoside triphosphate hydrolase protein, partial [Mycena amicta]